MRVLAVGNDLPVALETSYLHALRRAGHDARLFDWWRDGARVPRGVGHRGLGAVAGARRGNAALLEACRSSRPDLLLVFKGLHVRRDTIESIRDAGVTAFCLNPDNPFNPSRTSSSPHILPAVPSWDCYFIWGRFLVERLYAIGARRAEYLPFAWDPDAHPYQEPAAEPRFAVSFVGNHSPHRERWLGAAGDLDLHVWGHGWDRAGSALRGRVRGGPVRGREFSDIVRDSAVSLNVLDPWNVPSHNMRSFELPGCGGLQLSTHTDEVASLFLPDEEYLAFRTVGELRDQVHAALDAPEERRRIAKRGHERVRDETFDVRAATILEVYRELRG